MARVLRGDVFWADLSPTRGREQAGLRPVLILSENVFNKHSGTAIAMSVTSRPPRAGFPLTLEINSCRLPKRSWIKISQVRTLSTQRLGRKLGRVSTKELDQIVDGLNEIIGG